MKAQIIILAALMTTLAACKKEKSAPAEETPDIDVAVVTIDSVTLSKAYPGVLTATQKVEIVGRVNGYLLSQNFEGGAHVNAGDILFRIEDTQYRDAVTQAAAQLETARSSYEYASRNYAAMQRALESDAVAQIQVLQSKNAMEEAQAAVSNAEAALETARTNLSYCTVRAPFGGDMTLGIYTAGTYIGGAASPVTLATLYDNSTLYANFSIDDAAYMRNFADNRNRDLIDYDSVPLIFSENLPHLYKGKLSYISPQVDTSTGTLMLRIRVDSPYGELKDGMYVRVNLPYAFEPRAIMVKDAAISTTQTEKYLYVVNDSNRVVYTPIQIGEMANDSMRIVTSGLRGDEKYVTRALLKVRPGMTVNPVLTR